MFRFRQSWQLLTATFRLWSATPLLWTYCLAWIGLMWLAWWPFSSAVLHWGVALTEDPVRVVSRGAVWFVVAYVTLHALRMVFCFSVVGLAAVRLSGQTPRLTHAARIVVFHWRAIVALTVLHSIVGVMLAHLRQRLRDSESVVASGAEGLWGMTTALTVPSMVLQFRTSVQDGLEESAALFKRTWGENLMATVTTRLAMGSLHVVVMGAWVAWSVTTTPPLSVSTLLNGVVCIALTFWIVGEWVSETLHTVLYVFATEGQAPEAFAGVDLAGQFVSKSVRA